MAQAVFRLVVSGPDLAMELEIGAQGLTIGRDINNTLQLSSPKISRQHASILSTPEGCQVVDLDSSNGTFLNGEKLAADLPMRLKDGDILKIGPYSLVFLQEPGPSPFDSAPSSPAGQAESQPEVASAVSERPSPPPGPPPSASPAAALPSNGGSTPGLSLSSRRLLSYLPEAYATDFMDRFLALFESILFPIEWNIDNFDLFLDPGTAPAPFLAWLAAWYCAPPEPDLDEAACREFLKEASQIYARRGTPWALSRILEIATGKKPEIIDTTETLPPFTFLVRLPFRPGEVDHTRLERIIAANKPAYTSFQVEFKEQPL